MIVKAFLIALASSTSAGSSGCTSSSGYVTPTTSNLLDLPLPLHSQVQCFPDWLPESLAHPHTALGLQKPSLLQDPVQSDCHGVYGCFHHCFTQVVALLVSSTSSLVYGQCTDTTYLSLEESLLLVSW